MPLLVMIKQHLLRVESVLTFCCDLITLMLDELFVNNQTNPFSMRVQERKKVFTKTPGSKYQLLSRIYKQKAFSCVFTALQLCITEV
jgi:hypothetical protein